MATITSSRAQLTLDTELALNLMEPARVLAEMLFTWLLRTSSCLTLRYSAASC
jgi:hypothetical protein